MPTTKLERAFFGGMMALGWRRLVAGTVARRLFGAPFRPALARRGR